MTPPDSPYHLAVALQRGDREAAWQHFARLKKLDDELAARLRKQIYQGYVLDAATFEN